MKNFYYLIVISFMLFRSSLNAQWVPTGFTGFGVRSIVSKEGNLFASTWGSYIFRSTDGGATWEQDTNGLAPNWLWTSYVYDLAVVPSSDNSGHTNLFAAMEEGGIWRSTNNGDNWTWVYPGGVLGQHDVSMVRFGVAGSTILAGVATQPNEDGVYRSIDDGVSWTRTNSGFQTAADSSVECFASLIVGPTKYFYVGTSGGVFMSITDGTSWTRISNGLPPGIVSAVTAAPDPRGVGINLFAGVGYLGIYHSSDNGANWSVANNGIPTNGTSPYIAALVASPVPNGTTSNIFAIDGTVYVSTNYGVNWWDTGYPVSVASSAEFLGINGDILYAGGYGIYKYSTVIDTGWVVQASGTGDTLWTVKAVDNNVVWTAGTNGGVFRTTNGGAGWSSVGGGTIGSDVVYVIEPLDANTAFASTSVLSILGSSMTKIFKTTNGGSSWSQVYNQPNGFIGGIQMQSAQQGYAFGTPVGGKWTILKTTDAGNSWNRLTTEPVPAAGESALLAFQLLGNTLWFGSTSGRIYRSTNLGAAWSSDSTSGAYTSSLHFNSPSVGLTGFYGGVTYSSTDGGASWDSAGSTGTKLVSCISGLGNEFWATTGAGIAYSNNAGQKWTFSNPGHWGLNPLNAVSISPVTSRVNGWAVGESGMILHYQRSATSVNQVASNLPTKYGLEQNYPNPFNPSTIIRYELPFASKVTITIYNLLGQEIKELVNNSESVGNHEITFNGSSLASGIYFYRINASSADGKNSFDNTKKLMIMK